MMAWRIPAAAVAFGVILVASGGAGAQTGSTAAASAAVIGTDFNGAQCRWEARIDLPRERSAPLPANVFCGAAKQPTGSVVATLIPAGLPTDEAARHRALERVAAETPAGRGDAARLTCRAAQWAKTPGGIDLMLQPCIFNDNEWPQVLAVAVVGPLLMRAEGLASGLPAYEQVMARMLGRSGADATAPFGPVAAMRTRMAKLGGTRWLRASAEDYDDYGALTESARVESSRKNFSAAEDHYRRALAILTKVFGDRSTSVGLLLAEIGLEVSNQERFDEAAALFRRAEPIITTGGSASDRARLQLYLAFDAANRGRFDEALQFADNAAASWRNLANQGGGVAAEIGSSAAPSATLGQLAFALDLEAEMALRTGNLTAADAAVSEAEGIVAQVPGLPPWWRPEILTTIGEIRAAQGREDAVDASFRAALILDERLFGNTAPTAVTDLVIGRVFTEEKRYGAAVRAFRLALAILRKDEVARSAVIVDQIAPFVVAANAVAHADPSQRTRLDAEVFEATQLIGKSLVDDTVNRVAARLASAAPAIASLVDELEATRRQRDSARLALAHEVSLPNDQRGSERENALMAQVNAATAKADALQKRITREFPAFAKFANPGPVPLAELQKALHGDEALVLFEAGRERSFELLVRKDRLIARPMDTDRDTLADDIGTLRKAFVVRERAIGAFDTEAAYFLYRSLFGAIESGLNGVDHLIVVPTGALASLPLGLLVTERPKAGAARDYAHVQWLLRRTAISEVPSTRGFITLRDAAATAAAPRPLLAIGDPDFGGTVRAGAASGLDRLDNACRDAGPVPPQLLRALPPLPDTAAEVRRVAAILDADSGSILLGAAATEPNFRAMPLAQYRVLYFATHGLLPTALRCQSEPALVLTPPAEPATTRAADGVLDASEVAQLRLNADLVVLSACNTASGGGQFGGASLSGLARAFFHAGARAVLASHWEVPSAQTVQLMTGLFQRLGPNLSGGIAEALRQSQLALIARPETAHPFFWAAFTLIGDGGQIAPHKSAGLHDDTALAAAALNRTQSPLENR
ncbi:MAG TPA: CHAT domain-containing tetratricopeptide repeat protein [Stellaceae bacterium]|nr:CHAT domain-containing tetratricopeptide repeat protein [Stellaceae bacterium]